VWTLAQDATWRYPLPHSRDAMVQVAVLANARRLVMAAETDKKRIVITAEVDAGYELDEAQEKLLGGWVERWPLFPRDAEVIEIQEVQPCAVCGFARTCKRVFGEDCHS
jgi:hypothetical protein